MNNDSHAYKGTGFKAIPTTYRGIEFRSRFESEVAMLLDKMGLDWQYEPKSFLLPGGHYMPDFFVPSQCLWVESRGYDNKDWQIEQFSEHIKTIGEHYIVFKNGSEMLISKSENEIAFDASSQMGHTVKVSIKGGHVVIFDIGRTYPVMEWPGFSSQLNLANILREERKTAELRPLGPDFYLSAIEYIERLGHDSNKPLPEVEKQIAEDTFLSEVSNLSKLVDQRIKKIVRMAIRNTKTQESPDTSIKTPVEIELYDGLCELIQAARDQILLGRR
jgi:hypothetical protein